MSGGEGAGTMSGGGGTMRGRRVLIALGGNAMTSPEGRASPVDQIEAIDRASRAIADVVAAGAEVVLTHGNGPQVGNLLVKNEMAASVVPPVPLDWCVAQTQGTIGAMLIDAVEHSLATIGHSRPLAAVVTRTLVDPDDPGFANPTKPIGRYLTEAEARVLMDHGQAWQNRGPRGWRRMVASPEPLEILDAPAVLALLAAGFIVVAAGGGGIPVVRKNGVVQGVEAVIDKDLTAALLARAVDASTLVIATDVDAAVAGYGTAAARPIGAVSVSGLRRYEAEGHFASGSMGPKVDAACRFVESGGDRAVITSLDRIADPSAGTVVTA
jgi:carbamate kinase